MTIVVEALKRMGIAEESLANFGTDLTSSASYQDTPFKELTDRMEFLDPVLDPDTAVQLKDDYPRQVLGPKGARLSFDTLLFATGTAAGDGVASITESASAMLKMLEIAFGGISSGNTGQLINDASPTATGFTVDDASAFPVGGVIGLVNPTSGDLEVREVRTVSVNAITVNPAFSFTPVDDQVCYAATTVYLTEDPTKSLQCKLEGLEQQDRWLLMGGQVDSLGFSFPIGDLPTMSWAWRFANHLKGSAAASPFSGSALGQATYNNFQPISYTNSKLLMNTRGTTTLVEIPAPEVNYETGLSYLDAPSASGVNTIEQRVRAHNTPAWTINVTDYFQEYKWFDAAQSERTTSLDRYYALHQIGNVAGKTVVISMPNIQILPPNRVGVNDLAGIQFLGQGTIDDAAASEIGRSVVRISFI